MLNFEYTKIFQMLQEDPIRFCKILCMVDLKINVGKEVCAENIGDPFNKFLKILSTGSMSSRKHELEIR